MPAQVTAKIVVKISNETASNQKNRHYETSRYRCNTKKIHNVHLQEKKLNDVAVLTYTIHHCVRNCTTQFLVTGVTKHTRQATECYIPQRDVKQLISGYSNLASGARYFQTRRKLKT